MPATTGTAQSSGTGSSAAAASAASKTRGSAADKLVEPALRMLFAGAAAVGAMAAVL